MLSIKSTFIAAASGTSGFSFFGLLAFAIAILDDTDRREQKRRKKRDRAATLAAPKARPPSGPRLP